MDKEEIIQRYLSQPRAVVTRPVALKNHTMKPGVLRRYISKKKFSQDQYREINKAVREGLAIQVHGIYEGFAGYFIEARGYTVVGEPYTREPRREKWYNSRRPVLYRCRLPDDSQALLLFVFSSREYVLQYAEVMATYCAQRKAPAPITVTRYHYPQLEEELAEWSQLRKELKGLKLSAGALVVMGELDEINKVLRQRSFPDEVTSKLFGLDQMYQLIHLTTNDKDRQIFLLAVIQCFWGSAAGRIVEAVVEAGARHIIYAAKAGTLVGANIIHEPFCPSDYLLTNYKDDNQPEKLRTKLVYVSSPIRDRSGLVVDDDEPDASFSVLHTGTHVSVPSVMGETHRQLELLKKKGAVTIDNEISHMADAIKRLNDSGYDAEFTALHFITDYLHDPLRPLRKQPRKADDPDRDLTVFTPEYYGRKKKVFQWIGAIINIYAALTPATLVSRAEQFEALQYSIPKLLEHWALVVSVLRTHGATLRQDKRVQAFILRSRYSAYYNNAVTFGHKLVHDTYGSFVDSSPRTKAALEMGLVLQYTKALSEFYQNRVHAGRDAHKQNLLRRSARGLGELAKKTESSYFRGCCLMGQAQVLERATDECADLEMALKMTAAAGEEFARAAELTDDDRMVELLHLDLIRYRILRKMKQSEEACALMLEVLQRWDKLLVSVESETVAAAAWRVELACIKNEYLEDYGDTVPPRKKEQWAAEIANVEGRLRAEYVLLSRFIQRPPRGGRS